MRITRTLPLRRPAAIRLPGLPARRRRQSRDRIAREAILIQRLKRAKRGPWADLVIVPTERIAGCFGWYSDGYRMEYRLVRWWQAARLYQEINWIDILAKHHEAIDWVQQKIYASLGVPSHLFTTSDQFKTSARYTQKIAPQIPIANLPTP